MAIPDLLLDMGRVRSNDTSAWTKTMARNFDCDQSEFDVLLDANFLASLFYDSTGFDGRYSIDLNI